LPRLDLEASATYKNLRHLVVADVIHCPQFRTLLPSKHQYDLIKQGQHYLPSQFIVEEVMAKKDPLDDIPHERNEPRPASLSKPIPGKPLPKKIENILNSEEKLWEVIDDDQQ
jgi:hypothetical protein